MRTAERSGRTVTLRLRFDDFSRATRSHTLPQATDQTRAILITARALLSTAAPLIAAQGITMIGISVGNLENEAALQLALPFDKAANDELDTAMDRVKDKFGTNAITRGILLGRDQGLTVPMLPD
jgi:DNA polymerase-4